MSEILRLSDADQIKYSSTIIKNFPGAIPIVITPAPNKKLPKISKEKYLVKGDLPASFLFNAVRKYINLSPENGLFLFTNNFIINGNSKIGDLYRQHNKNGILFLVFDIESVFGNDENKMKI
jgi:hypothetical protein